MKDLVKILSKTILDSRGQGVVMEKPSIRDKEGQRRYMKKLSIIGGFDTYESERNEWQDDVDLWPSTTCTHLGMYLLINPSPYTGEDLMNYKSLACYINFVSCWVREVFVMKVDDKRVVIVEVSHACLDHQAIVPTTGFNNVILLPIFYILPFFLIVSILSQNNKISDSLEDRNFCLVKQDAVQFKQDHQYYYQVCYHGSSYCNLIYYIIVPSSIFFS